ncbi:MAG TPA: Type 1 glutamine amidotransferase-like domain-containing protein [Candidatus Udaeobacter sp.]|nr:Type 1 glutamine amidotransferase-like domain-containing protein [Candidatus Udaeobacter sp.]
MRLAALAALVLSAATVSFVSGHAEELAQASAGIPIYDIPAHLGLAVAPIPQRRGRGTLILEGGGHGAAIVTQQVVAYSGPDPVLCLIDSASDGATSPEVRFDAIGGLRMLVLDITPDNAGDPAVLDALRQCTGFYLDGGNPGMLSAGLLQGREDGPALAVIREKFEREGAVVAGTSAGAMIAGPLTLCECGSHSSELALGSGKLFQAPGFHFIDGPLIDAHFFARGLIGRHLYALATTGNSVGIGIDEATAVIVPADGGLWTVEGDSAVAFIYRAAGSSGKLDGFTFNLLASGDRFDPASRRIVVDSGQKPAEVQRGADAKPFYVDDIFSPGKVKALVESFIGVPTDRAEGISKEIGRAIVFTKRPDTMAYADGARISVLGLDLGVSSF